MFSFFFLLLAILFPVLLSQPTCRRGFRISGSSCKPCKAGTYSTFPVSIQCLTCPPGTYSEVKLAMSSGICAQCPPGTFNSRPGAKSIVDCKPCPRGKDSSSGAPVCNRCRPGFKLPTYSNFERDGLKKNCQRCEGRQFNLELNVLKCQICPAGFIGNSTRTGCLPCPAGSEPGRAQCRECDKNSFSTGAETCQYCSAGTFPVYPGSARRGAKRCDPCPSGTFNSNGKTCSPCRPGENTGILGGDRCIKDGMRCPVHYFKNVNGACRQCFQNERFVPARNICVPCPEEKVSNGGVSSSCRKCPRKSKATRDGCACIDGYVPSKDGCMPCPVGTVNTDLSDSLRLRLFENGKSACLPCRMKGGISTKTASTECTSCPYPQIPNEDSTACVECPRGLRLSASRMDILCVVPNTDCPPNTLRVDMGAGNFFCRPDMCPSNTFSRSRNGKLIACDQCRTDYQYNPITENCDYCDDGYTSDGANCRRCPGILNPLDPERKRCGCVTSAHQSLHLVGGVCKKCPKGTSAWATSNTPGEPRTECIPCGKGQFSDEEGSIFCKFCPPGFFTNKRGQKKCKKCPDGLTSYGLGDPACVPMV